MSVLSDLEPKAVWKHFDELRKIPRGSGNEARARDYVIQLADRLGLEKYQDAVGNLVVRKPARLGREKAIPALLQGHLDMVCEKNESKAHDFEKDPIELVRDGDWLKANGTTLGADNGVGVAAALAVMESKEIAHGPMEFVFTIDEETGLTGAAEFQPGVLKSKYFINLDGEEKGTLCIGCAGGINSTARRKIGRKAPGSGTPLKIKVTGLKGGHSGVDIHLGRGNAIRVLGRTLQALVEKFGIEIADIRGGSKRNVIPREASAIIVADERKVADLKTFIAQCESEMKTELGQFDPGLQITAEATTLPKDVIASADAKAVVDLLVCIPHGVISMSPDIAGLVQTSTNLATIATETDFAEVGTSQRSAIEASKMGAVTLVATACRLAGFNVESNGGYPGWKPEPNSEIVQKVKKAYEEVFGEPTRLVAMHAGLECGVIGEKYPGMQMVSFGPQIENPHSPNERIEIPSVAEFWKLLTGVLERL